MRPDHRRPDRSRRSSRPRPLGAVLSQVIVAGSSLVLQLVALRELGTAGLGAFSLLLGILVTVNSVQTGWLGDSLTVLDRFDPGIRRALLQSQIAVVVLVGSSTTVLATLVDGVDGTTAALFGLASVAWVIEETLRRLLIARREFWRLVANDLSFVVGSFGLVGLVIATDGTVTLETLVLALLAGAVTAVAVGIVQLPGTELLPGVLDRSRMRDVASFAFWRSIQVGLRPGSQAVVRAVVATFVSLEALGTLEAARLLVAPVLTVVNGAGVYLLPTYSDQVRKRVPFRPRVDVAMVVVAGLALSYGILALLLRVPLVDLLTDDATTSSGAVTAAAVAAWVSYSMGFGAGVPVGSAMVARGRSRRTFEIRAIDAAVGIVAAAACAAAGWVDAVPAGLALGTVVGVVLLRRSLRRDDERPDGTATTPEPADPTPLFEAGIVAPPPTPIESWTWLGSPRAPVPPPPPLPPSARSVAHRSGRNHAEPPATATRRTDPRSTPWQQRLLWMVPLLMIVATEYKIRRRDIDDALSGSIDLMIAAELAVYALVGVWALWRLVPVRPRLEPLLVLMWGYILTTAVSSIYSAFPLLAMARGVQLVIIGTVVHIVAVDGTLTTVARLLHGWIVLMTVSILAGLAWVAPTTGPQEGRFTWLSVHSVSAGSMLVLSVVVLFGLWLSAGRRPLPWPQAVYGLLFVLQFVFLLLTRTRGSIGGAVVAVAVMAWLGSGRRMKPELALGSLVAAGALALAFGRSVLEFLTRGETADQLSTFNRRTEIWSLAWESFLERPIFGLGFASAKGVFFDETGLGGAHNAAINVMIDVGAVGLLWWLALIVGCIVVLGTLRRGQRHATVPMPGATGSAGSDHLILVGLFTGSLMNSITTEGLGAGVNVSAVWLFLAAAWLTILQQDAAESASAGGGELRSEVRDGEFEPVA